MKRDIKIPVDADSVGHLDGDFSLAEFEKLCDNLIAAAASRGYSHVVIEDGCVYPGRAESDAEYIARLEREVERLRSLTAPKVALPSGASAAFRTSPVFGIGGGE